MAKMWSALRGVTDNLKTSQETEAMTTEELVEMAFRSKYNRFNFSKINPDQIKSAEDK